MGRNIEINIDELRLLGFSHADRYPIGQALQDELTRMIAENVNRVSLIQRGVYPQLDGGTLKLSQNSNAQEIGNQIAKSIYGGIIK